jgi:GDP-L-fucose synthase
MLGSHVARAWASSRPSDKILTPTRAELDLRDAHLVADFIARERPHAVIHCASKVSGIGENLKFPLNFMAENLAIDMGLITAAATNGVSELLYMSSATIYPAEAPSPIGPETFLLGPLEQANEAYALAKVAGTRACAYASRQYGVAFRAIALSNLYGAGDDFDLDTAHLVPAALAKAHLAVQRRESSVLVWGDGTARREFTYAGDVADWLVTQVGSVEALPPLLNLGVGADHSIRDYYELAADVVGFSGNLDFDASRPVGVKQRLLDSSEARQRGWNPQTSLRVGMTATYQDFLARAR